ASGAVAAWLHLRLAWALAGMAAGGEGARLRSAGRTSCPVGPATTYKRICATHDQDVAYPSAQTVQEQRYGALPCRRWASTSSATVSRKSGSPPNVIPSARKFAVSIWCFGPRFRSAIVLWLPLIS